MTFQQILLDPSLQWQFPSQLGLGRLWKLPTMGVITISSVLRWYGSRLWFVVRQIPNRWAYEVFGRLLLLQDSLFAPWFRCFCKFANEDCCVCVCTNVYSSSWDLCSNCQEIHGHSSDRGFPHVLTRMVQRVQCHQCRRRQHHHARWKRRRQFFEQGFQLLNYVKLHMFLQTIKDLQRFRTGSKKWPSF